MKRTKKNLRYHSDAAYRERMKKQALERYYQRMSDPEKAAKSKAASKAYQKANKEKIRIYKRKWYLEKKSLKRQDQLIETCLHMLVPEL